ncbi:MAG TPA: DUF3040 domain-containing protein [Actinomycetes bacterium]|nr:DUF3040 domain-containing protein [Actinomycetes bacterium]
MPLSEHEQHLLEQMERALYADDPKLASTLRGRRGTGHDRRRLVVGAVGLVVGVGLLIGGVSSKAWPLGVVGFLVMLGAAWVASSGWQTKGSATVQSTDQQPAAPGQDTARPAKAPRTGFMRRIEERWDRRRDERGR